MRELELVMPCYNEAPSIRGLIERSIASARAHGLSPQEFCLVLVNNGSTDHSEAILESCKTPELSPWFRVEKVHPNRGYGFGVLQGLRSTQANIVSWTHSDEQCDVEDVFRAFEIIRRSTDRILVKGSRHGRGVAEIIVSRIFDILATLILQKPFFEINAQPKVFQRDLLSRLSDPPLGFEFDLYVLFQARRNGYAIKAINVKFPERVHGVSNWAYSFLSRSRTILKMVRYMFKLRWETFFR